MAQSAEQLIEQLIGQIKRLGSANDAPTLQLDAETLPAALSLVQAPYVTEQRNTSKQAFKIIASQHDASWLAAVLRQADESLLPSLQEYLTTQAVPFYESALIGELDGLIRDHSLSPARRLFAAQLLHCHATLHPEYYGRVVKSIGERLQDYENNPAKVNAELVDACVNLHADELMPAIEKVFASNNINHPTFTNIDDLHAAMSEPETAFEQGLEAYLVTKELDEIRRELGGALRKVAPTEVRDDSSLSNDLALTNLAEVDGFLHALASSPTPVARSLWIEQLSACLLDDEHQEKRLEQVTTYYAQVKDAMTVGEVAPYFEGSIDSGVTTLQTIQPWARGYLLGLELWFSEELQAAEKLDSFVELREFLQSMAADQPLPEQYQSLANTDYSMIVQLMTQRVFSDLHDSNDTGLDNDDDLQDFFDNFG